MKERVVRRISARDIGQAGGAPGPEHHHGALYGRITKRRVKQSVTGAFVEYEGEFAFWRPAEGYLRARLLVLPVGLEDAGAPIPRDWTAGDFSGEVWSMKDDNGVRHMFWRRLASSCEAVNLPANIRLVLMAPDPPT